MKILTTNLTAIACAFLLMSVQMKAVADDDDFIQEQNTPNDAVTIENASAKRQKIEEMATQTLERLYKEQPKAEEEIKNAYAYGVFEGHIANIVLYVAGKGLGVVYKNSDQTKTYMNAVRAGTGPGVGYKSIHAVLVFKNETVYKQFTTVGLQVGASGDAVIKLAGKEAGGVKSVSLVPGVSIYQMVDKGLVLQANWGATEFLKDPILNEKASK
ncbi:MAG: hypothetical protein KAI02_08495 [Gammaproteobacteria bacterium]|nr:hypothetical protein [Gammaproteobacteria bacterium]